LLSSLPRLVIHDQDNTQLMALASFPQNITQPIKALGFDYGTQKIGVAYGQSLTGTANPITILKAKDGIPDWSQIESLLNEWKPTVVVVGLPYNLDGSESELFIRATKFGNRIHGRFGIPCYGIDERLSSVEAKQIMLEDDSRSKKKAAIDDIAAQLILENWFSELAARPAKSAV
jgi:putative Holliday junction resolvase